MVQSKNGLVPPPPQRAYEIQYGRLVVATDESPVALMLDIVSLWEGDVRCVYEVRGDTDNFRAESCAITTSFLRTITERFQEMLESDPRHNFTVTCENGSSVTLDEHNFLIVRGDLSSVESLLLGDGFCEARINYPTPHVHTIFPEFDEQERELISALNGGETPL